MSDLKEDLTKQLQERLNGVEQLRKKLLAGIEKMQGVADPKESKDVMHNNLPAKALLTKTGEVWVKFADEEEAEKFYKSFGVNE